VSNIRDKAFNKKLLLCYVMRFQVRNGLLCMYLQAVDWKACAKWMQLSEGAGEALKYCFTLCVVMKDKLTSRSCESNQIQTDKSWLIRAGTSNALENASAYQVACLGCVKVL
jgi:hypothetical protein